MLKTSTVLLLSLLSVSRLLAHKSEPGTISLSFGSFLVSTRGQEPHKGKRYSLGLSIRVLGDIDDQSGVEFTVLGFDKYYSMKTPRGPKTDRLRRLQIVSGYRHWVRPWLSISGGINSGYTMGDPKNLRNPCLDGCPNHKTNADTVTEYGIDLEGTVCLPSDDTGEWMLSSRYSWSLSPSTSRNSDTISLLVEWKLPVQKPQNLKKQ